MHCKAKHLGPTKKAELIEMSFGMMSGLGSRNSVLRGVTICQGEGVILGENICPISELNTYELQIGLLHAAACTR